MAQDSKDIYLLVEGEPYLSFCRDWRERWVTAKKGAHVLAEKHGASGFFPGFNEELTALTVPAAIPAGWRVRKVRRSGAEDRLEPIKGKDGDIARAEIAALPPFPRHAEIGELIGFPYGISYLFDGGSGSTNGCARWNAVQLTWPSDDTLVIFAPNYKRVIEELIASYPSCVITRGEWTPPAGLTLISKAKYKLLVAQAELEAEESNAE